MKKFSLFIAVVLAASVCFANRCCRCSTTAPLRKVKEGYYCNKHYCNKHKLINNDGKCQMCELESIQKRGKGECLCCKATKCLTIVKYDWNRWGLFCTNHYCAIHNLAPYRMSSDSWTCYLCKNEDDVKKREQEKVARQKEMEEAKIVHERKMSEIAAKAAEDRERMRQKQAQDFKDLCTLKSESLKGLFGVNLGATLEELKSVVGDGAFRAFSPQKKFRQFSHYDVAVEEGKIRSIFAHQEFDDWDDAESEVWSVVDLLDRKFGSRRRGEVQKNSRTINVCYEFGCDPDTGKCPKQCIYVTARKSSKCTGGYVVVVRAEDSVVNARLREKEDAANIDAL